MKLTDLKDEDSARSSWTTRTHKPPFFVYKRWVRTRERWKRVETPKLVSFISFYVSNAEFHVYMLHISLFSIHCQWIIAPLLCFLAFQCFCCDGGFLVWAREQERELLNAGMLQIFPRLPLTAICCASRFLVINFWIYFCFALFFCFNLFICRIWNEEVLRWKREFVWNEKGTNFVVCSFILKFNHSFMNSEYFSESHSFS